MCEIKINPYKGHIEKLKDPIELKGRVIKYKPVAKLTRKKGLQKGGLQDFFNFCIKLPYEKYLKDFTINSMIKTLLKIDCDIDIGREIFYYDKLLILVKVFPKTFSNNSTYILDLKKSVMDLFKENFKKAKIFDCGIPSAPPLNIINNNNNKNSRQQNTEKDITIILYFKDSKKIEEIYDEIKSILKNIFYKKYVININNNFLEFRGKTKLNKEEIEQYREKIDRKLNDIRNVISKTTKYNILNEISGILRPIVTEF